MKEEMCIRDSFTGYAECHPHTLRFQYRRHVRAKRICSRHEHYAEHLRSDAESTIRKGTGERIQEPLAQAGTGVLKEGRLWN